MKSLKKLRAAVRHAKNEVDQATQTHGHSSPQRTEAFRAYCAWQKQLGELELQLLTTKTP